MCALLKFSIVIHDDAFPVCARFVFDSANFPFSSKNNIFILTLLFKSGEQKCRMGQRGCDGIVNASAFDIVAFMKNKLSKMNENR